jgi:protease-4
MSAGAVDSVGQGRVWSGVRARAFGLVDSLGGLEEAFGMAKSRAGIDQDADIVVDLFRAPSARSSSAGSAACSTRARGRRHAYPRSRRWRVSTRSPACARVPRSH